MFGSALLQTNAASELGVYDGNHFGQLPGCPWSLIFH